MRYLGIIFVLILIIICIKIKMDNKNLIKKGQSLISNPTDMGVREYIGLLKLNSYKKTPEEWKAIRDNFYVVYNSKNVTAYTKKVLYDYLLNNGCDFGDFVFRKNEADSTRLEEIKEHKSNEEFENILKTLPDTYKILNGVKLFISQDKYEIKYLVIGPNGLFIIENKRELENEKIRRTTLKLLSKQVVLEENLERYFEPVNYEVNSILAIQNMKNISYINEKQDIFIKGYDEIVNFISTYVSEKINSEKEINNIYELFKLTEIF